MLCNGFPPPGFDAPTDESPSPPPGIILLCFFGLMFSLLGFVFVLGLMSGGGLATALGAVLLVVNVATPAVLYGLFRLESWAWTGALLLYGSTALLQLFQLNLLGVVTALFITYYVYSKKDLYSKY